MLRNITNDGTDSVSNYFNQYSEQPSSTYRTHIDRFINGMKSDNQWSLHDHIFLRAADKIEHSKICMINPAFTKSTYHGTTYFYPQQGIKGSTTGYIDTKFNPFTQGVNFNANSQCLWVWVNTRPTGTSNFQMYMGSNDGSIASYLSAVLYNNIEGWAHGINLNYVEYPYPTGLILFRKNAAGVREIWVNGVLKTSQTQVQNAVPNRVFYELAWNSVGNPLLFSNATISLTGYCSAEIDPVKLYTHVSTLANNLGFATNLDSGLQYYFPLNGNSNELIKAGITADTDITYANQKIGQGASFNGTTSRIGISNVTLAGDFTINFWIYPATNGAALEGIFMAQESYGVFCYHDSGIFYVGFSCNVLTTQAIVTKQTWSMMTFIRSENNLYTYVNGQLLGTGTMSNNLPITIPYIGYVLYGVADRYFSSTLDELAVWNRVLSSAEIQRLYNNTIALKAPNNINRDLIGYWPLDQTPMDVHANNYISHTDINYTAGKIDKAAVFNGTTSQITFNNLRLSNTQGSMSFWCYHTNFDQYERPYSDAGGYAYFEQGTLLSGRLYFWVYNGVSGDQVNTTYELNTWIHWVATWENLTLKLYKNGVLVDTKTASAIIISQDYNGNIGSAGVSYPPGYFTGRVDEFAVWNRALSLYDVQYLYNSGNGISLYSQKDYSNLFEGLQHNWIFDGNGNDSIGGNSAVPTDIAYVAGNNSGLAADFNGTSSKYTLTTSVALTLGQPKTFNFWVYWINTGHGFGFLFNSSVATGYGFYTYTDNSIYNGIFFSGGTVGAWSGILPWLEWSMVTFTFDTAGVISVYVNGVFQNNTGRHDIATINLSLIGYNIHYDVYYDSKLDQISVWDRVLSPYEIKQLYNNGYGRTLVI